MPKQSTPRQKKRSRRVLTREDIMATPNAPSGERAVDMPVDPPVIEHIRRKSVLSVVAPYMEKRARENAVVIGWCRRHLESRVRALYPDFAADDDDCWARLAAKLTRLTGLQPSEFESHRDKLYAYLDEAIDVARKAKPAAAKPLNAKTAPRGRKPKLISEALRSLVLDEYDRHGGSSRRIATRINKRENKTTISHTTVNKILSESRRRYRTAQTVIKHRTRAVGGCETEGSTVDPPIEAWVMPDDEV